MNKLNVSLIGVPMDHGQNRRGVDMGPSAIRYAGVKERIESLGHSVVDEGDVHVGKADGERDEDSNLRNLEVITDAMEELGARVQQVAEAGKFPLVLGGDHSIAIGTLAGISPQYENLGVIWYDAHADMNTSETSPSGNIHGMPLAASFGHGHEKLTHIRGFSPKVKPENIVIIGARSVDPGERELIRERGIRVYSMHEIDKLGMNAVIEDALRYLKEERGTDGIHLSLDLDGIDPMYTPGVGTPVPGGISYRESHLAMEMLYDAGVITSAEFVEVNPILDEKNKTADVAVALIGSLLGEKLL
ncbi:arginase [Planomicrobium sp. YIM 101495]|uniref:arginase n=1 Tax=Planomicrobium sp. YIM 101495 TaxID=2665160 RepID=UPI0012B797DE|nr:arginase [Planomicrobium sp. YIM 101495]MTD31233.1 arginase [Planomicrobium sp. YIM 101495]